MLNFFGGLASDVKNFVLSVAKKIYDTVGGWIENLFTWAGETIYSFAEQVWHTFDGVWRNVNQLVGDAENYLQGVFHSITDWLWQQVQAVMGWAQSALDWIGHAASVVGGWIATAVTDFYNAVVAPVLDWIGHAADFVWHIIDGWWQFLVANVFDPIWAQLDQAWHWAQAAWHWVSQKADAVWHVVSGAWDWLVWMAEHAFGFWRVFFEGWPGGQNVQRALSTAEASHWVDLFGEAVDKVLS